jgi:hypothetical protein
MRSEHTRCWNDRTWKKSVTDRSEGSYIRFRGERPGKSSSNLSGGHVSGNTVEISAVSEGSPSQDR